jgi:isoquinoline 1-oxidoreductase beta subunit
MSANPLTRRDFLKASAAAGGGLAIGFHLGNVAAQPATPAFTANAWVKVAGDGTVTLTCHRTEMGQDVHTSLAMMLAEELGVDPRNVRIVQAGVDPVYINKMLGGQLTGGSTSIRDAWEPVRRAGATARVMLVQAAGAQWNVPASECRVENGTVLCGARKASFGSLANAAAKQPVPGDVPLKTAGFTLIGTNLPRLDGPDKARGRTVFGLDVKQPGMLHAVLIPCPVIGGKVASFDAGAASKAKGVKKVVDIGEGVAVIADHYWTARKAAESMQVKWDEGPNASLDTAAVFKALDAAKGQPGFVAKKSGDASAALGSGAIEATYTCQMLSHATLEPQNCTARVGQDGVDVWGSMQFPQGAQGAAAQAAGVKPEQVRIHVQFLGGGFGRRIENDYVAQAVKIAAAVPGTPVKLIWSRPEDMAHDFYRPPSLHVLRGAVEGGRCVALSSTAVSPSITARAFPPFVKDGNDPFMTEGLTNLTYDIPNVEMRTIIENAGVRVGYWRSVSHALNAFATESFMDELAAAAKQDPLAFRLAMLGGMPRQKNVLERAARGAGYTATPASGRAFGVASMECYDTHVAVVCEVSGPANAVKLERITVCADCGLAVHPDQAVAQLEGGTVTGLIQAMRSKITLKNGRVEQSNFHDFQLQRMSDVHTIRVDLVQSGGKPGGIGEVGVPLVAPALANAVAALTGKRIRSTPLEDGGIRFA